MLFAQLNEGACRTYLVASEDTREALLVDPALGQVDHYLAELARRGLRLEYVLDTHVHADHLSAGSALRERAGVPYVMHAASQSSRADLRVDEADRLHLGSLEVRFLHTPGHTPDSLTVLLPDRILTGDFLFLGAGGAGRTDLPGGDSAAHWTALQKLASLSGDLRVFPGHDYRGRTESTLEEERRTNERLRPRGRDEYVAWLEGHRLGPAEWMKDVLVANRAGTQDPRAVEIPTDTPTCEVGGTASPSVRLVAPDDLASEIASGPRPLIVDVRQPDEFSGPLGHIQGARLLPLDRLGERVGELAGHEGQPLVTVCKAGGRSAKAAALLEGAGFRDVRSLDGGMTRWSEHGLAVERDHVKD